MYSLPKDVELSSLSLPRGARFFVPTLTGGPALFLVLAWLMLCAGLRPARAQDMPPPASCFAGAELNAAGVQEIEAAVNKILAGLKADAKTRCIKPSTTRRKGEGGLAYRFQYGKGESFVLYAPEDYHISLGRNITFPEGTTTAEVEDALESVAGKSQPFAINNYANGSLIITKNSAGHPGIRYFTYDFDSVPVSGNPKDPRTAQKAATQTLANDLDGGLSDVVESLEKATSFHVSFGIIEAGNKNQVDAIQKIVIDAMKANGSYRPLHSSNMGISAVALLESAHENDATRYTTYLEEPLGVSSLTASPGAGTIYSAPNMALADGQSWSVATGDRTFLGRATQADVEALLDWVEDQDALVVVGADPSFPGEGWLTIQGLAQPAQFNVGVATEEDTGHMVVGLKPADVGAVTLTGPLAQLAVGGDIDVGEYGTGTLSASGGATIASYGGYLGYRPGSLGTVTLQGAGTTWQVLNDFCVGYQGTGVLNLSQGARLLGNPDGESTLYVGSEAGSCGTVELTDPGTQIQLYEGILSVGSAGGGSMLIQNQAAAYSGYGYIGDQAGSQGTVQIAGAGSLWQVSDSLWVGISGQGALSVRDGAAVGCNYLTVAGFDGAAGALSISGPQSTVNVQQDAFIGGWMQSDDDVPTRNDWVNGGTATVLVENGGRLSVGGTVWIGGTSTVRLTGGTLEAENLDIMSGGVLASTGGALSIRRQISVDGTLETDGTLRIGNGMSLVGNGLICAPATQLAAGSLLAPGHSIGTLSFAGNVSLAPGSRFAVELADAGQCDRIVVSDTLQLGGTLALKKTTPGGPSWGYLFASAGQIEGAFDGIDASALGAAPKRIVPSSQWGLLLKFKDFADLATTQNARNAAAPLDAAIDAGQSNWLTDRLVTIGSDQAISQGLGQMQGELYASLLSLGIQNTTNVYRVLGDRLRPDATNWCTGTSGVASSNAVYAPSGEPLANFCPCSSRGDAGPALVDSPWGGWAIGYGLGGQALGDGNAHGADYSTGGTLVAIQRPLDSASRFGLFYGYGGFHVITQTIDQQANVANHQVGAFFTRELDDDYLLLAGSFGYDADVAWRSIAFDSLEATALGDHHGWQSAVYLERGHTFRGEQWDLQPYGAIQYVYLRQEAFAESGAEGLDLGVDGADLNSFRGLLGGRLTRKLDFGNGLLAGVSFRAIWMHEFLRQTAGLVDADFASLPGAAFAIRGLDLGRDWAVVGPGVTWAVRDRVNLFANYDVQFNALQVLHVGSGGVEIAW